MSLHDPIADSVDALAALVPDGASITLHKGDEPDVPMALGLALIRRGVRGRLPRYPGNQRPTSARPCAS